jgi:hypothetical protein
MNEIDVIDQYDCIYQKLVQMILNELQQEHFVLFDFYSLHFSKQIEQYHFHFR